MITSSWGFRPVKMHFFKLCCHKEGFPDRPIILILLQAAKKFQHIPNDNPGPLASRPVAICQIFDYDMHYAETYGASDAQVYDYCLSEIAEAASTTSEEPPSPQHFNVT